MLLEVILVLSKVLVFIYLMMGLRFKVGVDSTVGFFERNWELSVTWLGMVLLLVLVVMSLLSEVFRYQCWWYEFE